MRPSGISTSPPLPLRSNGLLIHQQRRAKKPARPDRLHYNFYGPAWGSLGDHKWGILKWPTGCADLPELRLRRPANRMIQRRYRRFLDLRHAGNGKRLLDNAAYSLL